MQLTAPTNSIATALDSILGGLGIASAATHDTVETHVQRVLADRGHRGVEIAGIRDGILTLVGAPADAHLAKFDNAQILAALTEALGDDTVSSIEVRVSRRLRP